MKTQKFPTRIGELLRNPPENLNKFSEGKRSASLTFGQALLKVVKNGNCICKIGKIEGIGFYREDIE
jgi:hypothetical protein